MVVGQLSKILFSILFSVSLIQSSYGVEFKGKFEQGSFILGITDPDSKVTIDDKKVNLDGGAIALGHPLGATGARITGKAAQLLKREKKQYALSTQCIGLGMGIATIIESIN